VDFLANVIQGMEPNKCDEKFVESLHLIIKMNTFPKKTQDIAQEKLTAIQALKVPAISNDEVREKMERTNAYRKGEVEIILEEIERAMSEEFPIETFQDGLGDNNLDTVMERYYGIKKPKDKV
jgi:hypothetical protein